MLYVVFAISALYRSRRLHIGRHSAQQPLSGRALSLVGLGRAYPVSAASFRLVERTVGRSDERFGRHSLPELGDSKTGRGGPPDTLDRDLSPDCAAKILGERHRACSVAPGQQDRELLASNARRKVGSANARADGVGRAAQDEIPDLVATAVVHPLETVEVEEHK
jgi:hypothetical protein